MSITRTACAKTCQHGATFIVETPLGYCDVMEVDCTAGRLGKYVYLFSLILDGWKYEYRLDRRDKLTRNGKSRLAAKFARECYLKHHWPATGRVDRWATSP